jgi:DNA polymerase-3 subunit beta
LHSLQPTGIASAQQDIAWSADIDDEATALVPAKTLLEVAKTFGNQGDISISIAKDGEREMIAFKAKNRSVTAQLIESQFSGSQTAIPNHSGTLRYRRNCRPT